MNAPTTLQSQQGSLPPKMKGGLPWFGHMFSFAANPYKFVERVANTTGEIASFTLLGQKIVLLTGDAASELFYRSSDEQLDQSAAYKLMTPIFGEGLVFDAPIERKNQQLKMLMPSLRMEAMRDHSHKIVQEVEDIIANWGDSGEVELVEFMKQLTINTASHCLLGREFRYELNDEFAHIYHDLEQGVSPLAYHFPYLPIPKFKRRDKARIRLQALVAKIVQKRESQKEKPSDLFQSLIDMRYEDGAKLDENEITGLLVGAIFAGHHTSSGTAAWVLLELLKNRALLRKTQAELDAILGEKGDVSFASVREMGVLENVLKEVLRLHPPLIILMRKVSQDLHFKNYAIKAGDMIWTSPPVTHRLSRLFSNPMVFDPDRFSPERKEDKNLMAYQPFGGGRHKCSGNAFAMFQIKAIFAVLLRRYDFELMASPETYVDDYTQMIVQPKSPCKVRYRLRKEFAHPMHGGVTDAVTAAAAAAAGCPFHAGAVQAAPAEAPKPKVLKVVVDRGLCQGHAMCMGEAPETFHVDANGTLEIRKPEVSADDLDKIERAVKFCPNSALKIVRE
jgi:sterol 14-demethylase